MPYATKQQQAILACLERRREEPLSAAELAAELRAAGQPVGLATIYRQLEKLEQAGYLHKVSTDEGAFFQYCGHAADDHGACILLQCRVCGHIQHLDCTQLQPLYAHLLAEHHFAVDPRRTLFTGLCAACAEREAEYGAN